MSAKTSVPRHYAELREYSPCRQKLQYVSIMPGCWHKLPIDASTCTVATYYFSQICLYVHTYLAMKKGTFSFNQCTYICTCMYCLLPMCMYIISLIFTSTYMHSKPENCYIHNLYYRLVHTCILSQRTVTYF